jgi:hypothetical protein
MDLEKIEEYPTKEKVLKSIERLKKMKFPKYKDEDNVREFVEKVSNILLNEFGFMLSPKHPFDRNDFMTKFFRVREIDSFTNIDLIREHSYPPIEKVKMGRCNFPKYPVFYCSNNPLTALLEVARSFQGSEKEYCISKWEIIPMNERMIFENFMQVDLPKENEFSSLKEGLKKKISSPFVRSLNKKLTDDQENGIIEYLTYLDSSFINDDDYSLSATLAHSTLYADHDFRTDVLMYPSVQTVFKGTNLAVQPNFVENNMRLTRLYIVSYENFNPSNGKINITFSRYGTVEKNVIKWRNLFPNDDFYTKIITEDFGNFVNSRYIEQKNNLP